MQIKEGLSTVKRRLKLDKRKITLIILVIILLIISVYLYIHRPTLSAAHELIGEDENRTFIVKTTVPPGSLVTMYKDDEFFIGKVAPKDSVVTINRTVTHLADKNGQAVFKILPNELRNDISKIHFNVKVPTGLSKNFYYPIQKTDLPITLKVNVEEDVDNNENIKRVTVVTDPLNTISIDGIIQGKYSETGKESFIVKDYSIMKLLSLANLHNFVWLFTGNIVPPSLTEINPENLPDVIESSLKINVTTPNKKVKSDIIPVTVSTKTNLLINQTVQETKESELTIKGGAPPATIISAAQKRVIANDNGSFEISVPLPEYGRNIIEITANRNFEKKSTETIFIDRLLPKVDLSIEKSLNGPDLTIKGTTMQGAAVTINGQPVNLTSNKFSWSYNIPYGVSKDFSFHIKAQKSGYRDNEQNITIDKQPVYRKPYM